MQAVGAKTPRVIIDGLNVMKFISNPDGRLRLALSSIILKV